MQNARKAEEALAEEQSRVVQLEVANAELRQKLGSMQELEKEVIHLRQVSLPAFIRFDYCVILFASICMVVSSFHRLLCGSHSLDLLAAGI